MGPVVDPLQHSERYLSVDLRGPNVGVSKDLLDKANVSAVLVH